MKNGSLPAAASAKAADLVLVSPVLQSVQSKAASKANAQSLQPTSEAMPRVDVEHAADAAEAEQALDPNEQTETRVLSRPDPVDDAWDLEEPAVTAVPKRESTAPGALEPIKSEPVKSEPVKSEPVKSEPVKSEPVKSEPVKSEPGPIVNTARFPSAMKELAESDPPKPEVTAAPSGVAAESPAPAFPVPAAPSPALAFKTSEPKTDEPMVPAPVLAIGAPDATHEDAVSVGAAETVTHQVSESPSVGAAETVTHQVSESPSVKLKAARPPQESLLSLDAAYAVEFFSSAPPPSPVETAYAYGAEFDELIVGGVRSIRPTEEQLRRQLYFRKIVLRVMLIALGLFAFALYVLWRRGSFGW